MDNLIEKELESIEKFGDALNFEDLKNILKIMNSLISYNINYRNKTKLQKIIYIKELHPITEEQINILNKYDDMYLIAIHLIQDYVYKTDNHINLAKYETFLLETEYKDILHILKEKNISLPEISIHSKETIYKIFKNIIEYNAKKNLISIIEAINKNQLPEPNFIKSTDSSAIYELINSTIKYSIKNIKKFSKFDENIKIEIIDKWHNINEIWKRCLKQPSQLKIKNVIFEIVKNNEIILKDGKHIILSLANEIETSAFLLNDYNEYETIILSLKDLKGIEEDYHKLKLLCTAKINDEKLMDYRTFDKYYYKFFSIGT